jgi:hypothetical protein
LPNGATSPAGGVDSNVTVTHFSENRGGIVEKISVPLITSNDIKSPKMDNNVRAANIQFKTPAQSDNRNPFLCSPEPTTPVSTNFTTTNPFLSSNGTSPEDTTDTVSAKDNSLTISFPAHNPFHDGDEKMTTTKSPLSEKGELNKFTADFQKPQTIEEYSMNDDDKHKFYTKQVSGYVCVCMCVCVFVLHCLSYHALM